MRKKLLVSLSIVLLVLGVTIIVFDICHDYRIKDNNKKSLKYFFEDNNMEEEADDQSNDFISHTNYIAALEIEKIGLYQGIVPFNKDTDTLKADITLLEESIMPDVSNGNFVVAAHSGTGKATYFNDIDKLTKRDIIKVYFNNKEYKYSVINNYVVDKTNLSPLYNKNNNSIITLITCLKGNNKKRLIIQGELI